MKPVIDISEFNTITNWRSVKENVEAVIIRMGYRGSVPGSENYGKIVPDRKYMEHRNACVNHGIPHSFYFFPTSINEEEAKEEADWVVKELAGFKNFATPVFADSERVTNDGSGRADKLDRDTRTQLLRVFCNRLQAAGIPAGVYASTSWLNNNLIMERLPYSVWCAQYASKCDYKGKYILWQYTSKGIQPGIKGWVDESKYVVEKEKEVITSAQKVIDIALAEVGYIEKRNGDLTYLYDKTANPGSANYTKYGYEMHQIYPQIMDYPAAWCDCFVDHCFMKAYGVANAKTLLGGDFDDYTVRSVMHYERAGAYHKAPFKPQPGDQIFFRNNSGVCHTGLVYKVDDYRVYTVEGNTNSGAGVVSNGGMVCMKAYVLNSPSIDGYGRPNYSNKTVTQTVVNTVKEAVGLAAQIEPAQEFDKDVAGSYQVTASALNLRSGAGTNFKIVTVVPKGAVVRCYGYLTDSWLYVVYGSYKGFCKRDYLRRI